MIGNYKGPCGHIRLSIITLAVKHARKPVLSRRSKSGNYGCCRGWWLQNGCFSRFCAACVPNHTQHKRTVRDKYHSVVQADIKVVPFFDGFMGEHHCRVFAVDELNAYRYPKEIGQPSSCSCGLVVRLHSHASRLAPAISVTTKNLSTGVSQQDGALGAHEPEPSSTVQEF